MEMEMEMEMTLVSELRLGDEWVSLRTFLMFFFFFIGMAFLEQLDHRSSLELDLGKVGFRWDGFLFKKECNKHSFFFFFVGTALLLGLLDPLENDR